MMFSQALSLYVDDGILHLSLLFMAETQDFGLGLVIEMNGAPDQNRTDTRSLEGYCSTIELQAR